MPFLNVNFPDDIWGKNPHLRSLKKARKFYEQEDVDEDWFNRVYYAIYLVYDPMSPYRTVENDLKKLRATVKQDYFEEPEDFARFNWFTYRGISEEYSKESVVKEVQQLEKLFTRLTDYQRVLDKNKPESVGDIVEDKKAVDALAGMWKDYFNLKKECEASQKNDSTTGYGGSHKNMFS